MFMMAGPKSSPMTQKNTSMSGPTIFTPALAASSSARTLRRWRENFAGREADARALGFDARFMRKWSYYLQYCEAAFAMRNISVVQTLHTRANNLAL